MILTKKKHNFNKLQNMEYSTLLAQREEENVNISCRAILKWEMIICKRKFIDTIFFPLLSPYTVDPVVLVVIGKCFIIDVLGNYCTILKRVLFLSSCSLYLPTSSPFSSFFSFPFSSILLYFLFIICCLSSLGANFLYL